MDENLISDEVFGKFCRLIYEQAGIHLTSKKRALVNSRLGKRMRSLGLHDFGQYYELVQSDPTQDELIQLLDAIATNVTYFFRESRHFDVLKDVLAEWERGGQTRFRLWSAACSTGEEPFSIAMTARAAMTNTTDTRILATDISTRVLAQAREGIYETRRLQHVPERMLSQCFSRHSRAGREPLFEVHGSIKSMIRFARLNLAAPPFPMRGPLDVIFCRNVMIYFDNEVRCRLLDELYRLLKPGGYLMVGHAESLSGMLSTFKSIEPSIYIRE